MRGRLPRTGDAPCSLLLPNYPLVYRQRYSQTVWELPGSAAAISAWFRVKEIR